MQVFVTPRAERNFDSIIAYKLKVATFGDFNYPLIQGYFTGLGMKKLLSSHFLM